LARMRFPTAPPPARNAALAAAVLGSADIACAELPEWRSCCRAIKYYFCFFEARNRQASPSE
jgi:hypothetical protein